MMTTQQIASRTITRIERPWRLVIIESPYAGDIKRNVAYARECVRDSLKRGEAPIASHLLYTQPGILRDDVPDERAWGMAAGLAWRHVAELSVFYIDLGWSSGMKAAQASAIAEGRKWAIRRVGVDSISESLEGSF
jgi:hypothetical protein